MFLISHCKWSPAHAHYLQCWHTTQYMSDVTGLYQRGVKRGLAELKKAGIVVGERKRLPNGKYGRNYYYSLCPPDLTKYAPIQSPRLSDTLPANESPPILNKGFEETLLKNGEAERTTNTESRPSTTKVEHSNRRTHAQMVRDAQAKYMDLDVSDREMCDEILKWYSTSVRGGGDDTLDPIRWDQTGPSSEAYWFYFAVCNPWRVWSALKEVSEGCQGRPLFRGTVLKRLSRVRRALAREMERGEAWEQEAVRAEIRRALEVAG